MNMKSGSFSVKELVGLYSPKPCGKTSYRRRVKAIVTAKSGPTSW